MIQCSCFLGGIDCILSEELIGLWFTAKYDILLEKTSVRIGVYMSFLTKDGGKKVGVDVSLCSHIPEEGRYLQACFFKIFFTVWCIYCSVG